MHLPYRIAFTPPSRSWFLKNLAGWVIFSVEDCLRLNSLGRSVQAFRGNWCSMIRVALGLVAAEILLSTTGCTTCCNPYYYWGSVWNRGLQTCCTGSWADSILPGTKELEFAPEIARSPTQSGSASRVPVSQTQQGTPLARVSNSQTAGPVTNRVAESPTASDDSSQLAVKPSAELANRQRLLSSSEEGSRPER
jgi:hypothetical protein